MTDTPPRDPLGVRPTRTEPRREFPTHSDVPRPVLPLDVAARIARDRLAEWRRDHGH
jgi:hypothetical protein